MNSKTILTHLVAALAAFGLGWSLSGGFNSGSADPGSSLASGDPATALESALSVSDPIERARRLADFFDQTDPSAALGLHEILRTRVHGLYVDEMAEQLFASWWARSDPETALRNPVNPPWVDRHPWARTVLGEWARRDPVAAALAVQQMPAGPLIGRLSGAREVVDAWLELDTIPDPTPLLGVFKQLEPMARGGAISLFVGRMIEKSGIDATLDFVRSVPPDSVEGGSIQHEFLARTAVVLIDHDIDRAIAWADEQQDGPNGAGVQKHLAYYWGLRDGRAAIEWALALPDGPAKSTIVKRAWISFSRKHREDAADWISSRAPDVLMRAAYTDFTRNLGESDPQAAIALANRAVDEEFRHSLLVAAVRGWTTSNPDAAAAWLTASDLPEGIKRTARSRPPKPVAR